MAREIDFDEIEARADYEAEMHEDDVPEMTEAEWAEWEAEQAAAAWCDAERKAERALEIGYGS